MADPHLMAGEGRTITFHIGTWDTEHWRPEDLAAARAADTDPHTWAADRLRAAMYAAGQAFVDAHPEVFDTEVGLL